MSLQPPASSLQSSPVRVVFSAGALCKLGATAAEEGATRVLLVTDPGIVAAGHVQRAVDSLREVGVEVTLFHGVAENPTTDHVAAGVQIARDLAVDFLVAVGGGSAMDAAKGINFILTNGGRMQDYWGLGKAAKPMLPFIAVPTTAGTGSEAQSFALITDPDTRQKMACGDKKALTRAAILDPELIRTVPRRVAAATGIDAIAHAVETAASTARTDASRALSREAWRRLEPAFEKYYRNPEDLAPREAMLVGAHLAGAAIEASMLGAAHACANPLTARYGIVHGVAVGVMLPHVVRFNSAARTVESPGATVPADSLRASVENPYSEIDADPLRLAATIDGLLKKVDLPTRLSALNVKREDLPTLAQWAATQWTAGFNPRPVEPEDLLRIYRAAFA